MPNKIIIQGLRLFGYHGVMPQERTVGAYFTVDVEVETDMTQAIRHDDLSGTISYADIFATIQREMAIPSALVEHVAGRMAKAIIADHPKALSVKLRLMKENPPMGAECQGAGVEIFLSARD